MNRSYSELVTYKTFAERFKYLSLRGKVGENTFGFDRYLNQGFYTSREWRNIRHYVIVRDNGCDLGIEGLDIHDAVYIHHINPLTVEHIKNGSPCMLDPDNLISVTHRTHNAIHYGVDSLLPRILPERKPGDTKLW